MAEQLSEEAIVLVRAQTTQLGRREGPLLQLWTWGNGGLENAGNG
jgi:hypothetical protein